MDVNLMLLTIFMILVGLNVVVVSYKLDDLIKLIKKIGEQKKK